MATKLFLCQAAANGIGSFKDMRTASESVLQTGTVNTAASGTQIQWTDTAGGAVLEWISGRVPAGGFTLSGTMTFSIWAIESNMSANCGARARVFKRTAAGSESEIGGGPWDDGVEFSTAYTEMVWTGTPTSTAFAENDRIIVRFYITNVGTMASGFTCGVRYGVADTVLGDSFFQINENVTFKSEDAAAGGALGGTVTVSAMGGTATGDGDAGGALGGTVTVTAMGGAASISTAYAAPATVTSGSQLSWDIVWTASAGTLVSAVASDDSDYAHTGLGDTLSTNGPRLNCTNFGISLPSGAVIDGVEVLFRKLRVGGTNVQDANVKLIVGGLEAGTSQATTDNWPGTESDVVYGGSASLWGTTITRAQAIASDFGVLIQPKTVSSSADVRIDRVALKIFYHVEATGDGDAGGALGGTVTVTAMGGGGTGQAAAGGALAGVTVSALTGTATVPIATGGPLGATVTVTAVGGGATGAAEGGGALSGVTVSSLTGGATGQAAAGGAFTTVTLSALAGGATGAAAISAALAGVVVSSLTGGATGAAAAGGSLSTVTISAMTGTAGSPIDATGAFGALVTVSSMGGGATGQAGAGGALATVTITALGGGATGQAAAGGTLSGVVVSSLSGAATGAAAAGGALSGVTISALTGNATVPIATGGPLSGVTVTPMSGGATGQGAASAAFGGTVTVTAMGANVTGGGSGNASGQLVTVTLTAMGGTASGGVNISGSLSPVTLTPLAGGAAGAANAGGVLSGVVVTSLAGSATGSANASGSLSQVSLTSFGATIAAGASIAPVLASVTITALGGAASGAAAVSAQFGATVSVIPMTGFAASTIYGPFTIFVRDRRGFQRQIGPFSITG